MLLTVVWALGLMMVLVTVFSLNSHIQTRTTQNYLTNTQARLDAESGLRLGILALLEQRISSGGGKTRPNPFDCRLENGTALSISIFDEAGKVDLNAAPASLLAALFEAVAGDGTTPKELAQAVLDFRDKDNVAGPQGAESDEYAQAGLGWRPKNAPFFRVEELEQVLGMTEDRFRRVRPYLTIHSEQIGVDPSVATQRVRSIVEDLDSQSRSTNIGLVSRSSRSFFTIKAEILSPNSSSFAFESIVHLPRNRDPAFKILTWRRADAEQRERVRPGPALSTCFQL